MFSFDLSALCVLFLNSKGVEQTIGSCIAAVTLYGYFTAGYVYNAVIIGVWIIAYIPFAFNNRINSVGGNDGTAGSIEKLNNRVFP